MILAAVFQYSSTALAAGLLALLPMVLHWLFRRRHLVHEWPSLVVLKRVVAARKQQMVWKQVLLLLTRALCILCIGYAISRPSPTSSWFWWAILPCSVIALLGCALLVTCEGRQRLVGLTMFIVCGGLSVIFPALAPKVVGGVADAPAHVVILIDTSASMSMSSSAGSRLDAAKQRALQIIQSSAGGSKFSLLSTDTSQRWVERVSLSAQRVKSQLEKLEVSAYAADMAALQQPLLELIDRLPSEPAPQLHIISDMQRVQWNGFGSEQLSELPIAGVYDVSGSKTDNVTVKAVSIVDPVLSSDIETAVIVQLGYEGKEESRSIEVRLFVGDALQSTQRVQIQAGAEADLRFQLSLSLDLSTGSSWIPIRVEVPPDGLAADNKRHLVVPVLRGMPVIFVDELGASGQKATEFSRGETSPLIDLIAPSEIPPHQWIVRKRHLQLNELDQKTLSDARFVFLAGVANPQGKVELLKQYVLQGGQLLIAAGGSFSAKLWNQFGWNGGNGVLPLPLDDNAQGAAASPQADTASAIDPRSVTTGSAIRVAGISQQEWRDMLDEAVIFQYVQQLESAPNLESVAQFHREQRQKRTDAIRGELARMDRVPELTSDQLRNRSELVRELDQLAPQWLNWRSSEIVNEDSQANVLATLASNNAPIVSSRRMGNGRVVFIGTGIRPRWNLIARFPAILMWDQLMRDALARTFPESDTVAREEYTMVLPPKYRNEKYTVERPDGSSVEPKKGFISGSEVGIQWKLDTPGVYELRSIKESSSEIVHRLSVNIDATEFELEMVELPGLEVQGSESTVELSGVASSLLAILALSAIFLELFLRPQGRWSLASSGGPAR